MSSFSLLMILEVAIIKFVFERIGPKVFSKELFLGICKKYHCYKVSFYKPFPIKVGNFKSCASHIVFFILGSEFGRSLG